MVGKIYYCDRVYWNEPSDVVFGFYSNRYNMSFSRYAKFNGSEIILDMEKIKKQKHYKYSDIYSLEAILLIIDCNNVCLCFPELEEYPANIDKYRIKYDKEYSIEEYIIKSIIE